MPAESHNLVHLASEQKIRIPHIKSGDRGMHRAVWYPRGRGGQPCMKQSKECLSEEVMLVCETDKGVDLPEEVSNFGIWKQKTYGISKVTVYVR